jgi:hypothetical protein
VTKERISEYDASADGNTDVNGTNIAEGCAPSGINNAIREVMAALKRFETGADGDSLTVGGSLVVSGSTTANTIAATVVNASGNATVGGTLVVTGATTFSGNVVVSGSTTATTVSATVVQSDTISEKTSAAGVTVDGVLLKDTTVTANTIKASGTSSSQGEIQLFEDTDNGTNYVALKAPADISSDVTWTLPDADGTANQALVTNGTGTLSWATAGAATPTTNSYTSGTAATWTKPSSANWVRIEIWGGGGSGAEGSANAPGGGGGGGAYNTVMFPFSELASSTVTYTVGAGGAGKTTAGVGNAGGTTSVQITNFFGATRTIYAYGGGAGGSAAIGGGGGGGGGIFSVGGEGGSDAGGDGGQPAPGIGTNACAVPGSSSFGGGGGGTAQGSAGGSSVYGGGGGGRGADAAGSGVNRGGNSLYGGGGGGGAANSGTPGTAGTSFYGGNGSAGTIDANNSAAGSTPGGGSGGTEGGDSGAGGAGTVRFTYW